MREIGPYLIPHGFARAHPVGPVRVLGGGSDESALRGCGVDVVLVRYGVRFDRQVRMLLKRRMTDAETRGGVRDSHLILNLWCRAWGGVSSYDIPLAVFDPH